MTLLDAILEFGLNHNLQVFGEYLCLFDSDNREHVKYVKFELEQYAEILTIQHVFKNHPQQRGWAYEQIVNRRVENWEYVKYPSYFVIAFEECARSDPDHYGPMICESFESFMEAYTDFWEAVGTDDRTPADVEPDEEYLREEHTRMAQEFSALCTPDQD